MVKNLRAMQETQVLSLGMEDPWRREWQPTPVLLPGEFHGLRSLAGYHPWSRKESDTTEQVTLHDVGCSNVLSDCLFQNGMQFKQRIHGHRPIPTPS